MDNICVVSLTDKDFYGYHTAAYLFIEQECERNNILSIDNIEKKGLLGITTAFCRYDRAINQVQGDDEKWRLDCVLYSNKPRKYIIQPLEVIK